MYQIKVVIKANKSDEFIKCLLSLSDGFRKEKGCLDFRLYRNMEEENTYSVVGEWRTREAMEKHFKNKNFTVLIGAARILTETFDIKIGEAPETGGFELVSEKITLHTGTDTDSE